MNLVVRLYLFVRTAILVMLVKYGIRKNAKECWEDLAAYDRACQIMDDLRLPWRARHEVQMYLFEEMKRYYRWCNQ